MRANSSLWGAGYRPGDIEQEMARERARGLSSSGPQSVTVSGQADINHEIVVRVEPSPLLAAIVEQARQQSETVVPLAGGGSGRMDSDAGPHRVGGIGAGDV